ncbi:GAK system XXXCH domain-containing protein [Desulfovibrio ferrophilus]|uniref:Uncharacterized protein n=1 Tax=Desulfovibrio ferrophilus TaxID=241368 RepID=A0A2Z6AV15_9BACT|nr:GAK system XXXCH domain-containing protein [Desulfovibrio ferrophilus]BBD07074.1 uncharacterized protein DFE_0348 [Desulfovibrio ferrophilus]
MEGSAVLQDHASFDYSEVKKRMKRDFRTIKVALAAGALPDVVVVDRFLVDSALIVRSPGDGDEYYGTYNEAIDSFTKAWKASDLVELRAAHQAITNCVKICHRMYK